MRKRQKIDLDSPDSAPVTLGSVIGPLAGIVLPAGVPAALQPEAAQTPDAEGVKFAPSLRVALERKGRSGKTVTLLFGTEGSDEARHAFAKELKRSLGCGAAVADGALVFQGDQRERLVALLKKHGAKKVVIS